MLGWEEGTVMPVTPLLSALRRTVDELDRAVVTEEQNLGAAQRRLDTARARRDEFHMQLPVVCAAAAIDLADVLGEATSATARRPSGKQADRRATEGPGVPSLKQPIALPSRPYSLRWFAGQALYEHGGDMPISDLGERMRQLGFEHSHGPANPHQLEQSLAALPNQIDWIIRGAKPGTLALDHDRLRPVRRD